MTEDFTLKQKWSHCCPGSENTSLAVMSIFYFSAIMETESAPGKLCCEHPALLEASSPVGGIQPCWRPAFCCSWSDPEVAALSAGCSLHLSTTVTLSPPLTESQLLLSSSPAHRVASQLGSVVLCPHVPLFVYQQPRLYQQRLTPTPCSNTNVEMFCRNIQWIEDHVFLEIGLTQGPPVFSASVLRGNLSLTRPASLVPWSTHHLDQ